MGANADVAVMHSRRWNWLAKEMTKTSWPLINFRGPARRQAVTNK